MQLLTRLEHDFLIYVLSFIPFVISNLVDCAGAVSINLSKRLDEVWADVGNFKGARVDTELCC